MRLQGPEVRLSPNAAISLTMALHELATNALKHGALSAAEGSKDLSWELDGESDVEDRRLT